MSRELKRWMAEDLREALEDAADFLVVGLLPLDSERTTALRASLRRQGARLRVIHNRTARHALPERASRVAALFRGQTAIAFGAEAIPVARAVVQAAREKQLELRGGFVEGELLDAPAVQALAASPDRGTLRAMALGAVLGPARGLAASLQAVAGGLARCLMEKVRKGGGEPAEAPAAPTTA
jgi:large subunit ribosomal protein L10